MCDVICNHPYYKEEKSKLIIRKQHKLHVNNLVGDVKANPRDFYRYINGQIKGVCIIEGLLPEDRRTKDLVLKGPRAII